MCGNLNFHTYRKYADELYEVYENIYFSTIKNGWRWWWHYRFYVRIPREMSRTGNPDRSPVPVWTANFRWCVQRRYRWAEQPLDFFWIRPCHALTSCNDIVFVRTRSTRSARARSRCLELNLTTSALWVTAGLLLLLARLVHRGAWPTYQHTTLLRYAFSPCIVSTSSRSAMPRVGPGQVSK